MDFRTFGITEFHLFDVHNVSRGNIKAHCYTLQYGESNITEHAVAQFCEARELRGRVSELGLQQAVHIVFVVC